MGICNSTDAKIAYEDCRPNSVASTSLKNESEVDRLKIFAATFNINGSPLSPPDVDSWLNSHGASTCDLLLLAFQECATCSWTNSASANCVRLGDKAAEEVNQHNDVEFLNTILSNLQGDFEILGDRAIGEPPTSHKVDIEGVKTEWYGFIRLVVLKKVGSPVDVGTIVPFECCCGSKLSMFPPHHYPENEAPDKGAVGFILQGPRLIVTSLHLMGTNKYSVPETKFDSERRRQLEKISQVIEARFEKYCNDSSNDIPLSYYRKVIMGDFNYRCELFPEVEDKVKGGKDFKAVNELAMSGKSDTLEDLFFRGDRLQRWLRLRNVWPTPSSLPGPLPEEPHPESFGSPNDPIPSIVENTMDAISLTRSLAKKPFPPPTFTFKIGATPPRAFNDKRTPSWTDRILVSNIDVVDVGTERTVVVSDHEPVYSLLC
mmetsp:Transcript_18757/g.39035  ORF Transcript_18757/g.39035 Transcript_18757/m.39035 type:complete len:431 (+) Transcript_18757:113-1405(+)